MELDQNLFHQKSELIPIYVTGIYDNLIEKTNKQTIRSFANDPIYSLS